MKLALNGATIMRSPLVDDVAIAAGCGFAALEIWAGKLDEYVRGHSLDELRERMRSYGIQPWCINSIEDITHRDADGRRDLMAQLGRMAGVARAIGAPGVVVVPGGRPSGRTPEDSVADAVAVLGEMAAVAEDVSLAFEFLGKPGCSVPALNLAIEIIERVDRANVGLVVDTFHFHAGGSCIEDIERLPIEKLLVVHLNGCEDLPKAKLTDAHRLYPGEGVIPIDAILSALRARGFDGTASIEIFRPAYWEEDPRVVARTAHAKASAVLERNGYAVAAR